MINSYTVKSFTLLSTLKLILHYIIIIMFPEWGGEELSSSSIYFDAMLDKIIQKAVI